MQFAAFHTREAEGLLCCADRGSLSAGVSVVKESLCAQKSQCGFCEQQDPPSTWGGARIIPIPTVLLSLLPPSGNFWLLPMGGRGTYRGICCLSRLWNDCVGLGRRQGHGRNVTGGYTDPHCVASVQVWLMHAGWKTIKKPFFTINLGGVDFHSESTHHCLFFCEILCRTLESVKKKEKRKKKSWVLSCVEQKMHQNSCRVQTALSCDSHTSLVNSSSRIELISWCLFSKHCFNVTMCPHSSVTSAFGIFRSYLSHKENSI